MMKNLKVIQEDFLIYNFLLLKITTGWYIIKAEVKMAEITLNVKDEVIKEYGKLFIKNFFEKQLESLSLLRQMDKIKTHILFSNMDYEKELENIKQKAWDEYKGDFLSE